MKVLDLFSGIGGFSYGLEQAGFETVAFCEINEFCQKVLAQNFPGVPIFGDIRTLTAESLRDNGIHDIDAICGGFPCQDVSHAGPKTGLAGERSGLWGEYGRLIRELRPRYVIVENVTGLLNRGMSTVLGDLASFGYNAMWDCIPASAVGAPYRRDRVFIVGKKAEDTAEAQVSDSSGLRLEKGRGKVGTRKKEPVAASEGWWETAPDMVRMVSRVPHRVDRIVALGNTVVPQVAKVIGDAVMLADNE